ncbi:hypothetical protein U1Q18_030156 [Sarracenia purpurea var. burkii]
MCTSGTLSMRSAEEEVKEWRMYTDGSSNQKGSRVGVITVSPERAIIEHSVHLGFLASNNKAKYKAFLTALRSTELLQHELSMEHRAISQVYWWLYMQTVPQLYAKMCEKCQRYSPLYRQPSEELIPITSPYPFA